jgi:hypothetical protein
VERDAASKRTEAEVREHGRDESIQVPRRVAARFGAHLPRPFSLLGCSFPDALSPHACCEQGYDLTGYRRDGRAGLGALGNLPGVRLPPPDTCSAVLRRGGASEAGSWVAMAVAGWMVGASVLWYAGAQEVLWTPFGDGPKYAPEPEVAVVHEAPPPKRDSPMKEVQPKPPPSGPPEAILTNAHHRDAGEFEGTFCWGA